MTTFGHGPDTMTLGDLEVKRLGFGAMQLPGPMVWGEPRDPDAARAVLRRVVELGIQLIDTSWYYGPLVANRLIAEALFPYPKDLVIATKLGGRRLPDKSWASALSPDELRQGCEEDLRSLRLERVDVVHLRRIHSDVPFLESLDAMIDLQRRGKIRHIGLSNVTLAELRAALARTPIVSVQNLYNTARGERQLANFQYAVISDQEAIVDLCAQQGIAYLPFFPLALPGPKTSPPAVMTTIAERHGITTAQLAVAYLLARSKTMLPIPGTSSVAHLQENWAAREVALSSEEIAQISAARA
jgi:aryl-alcohol dehydrogenase-like predicted oxidoreductase